MIYTFNEAKIGRTCSNISSTVPTALICANGLWITKTFGRKYNKLVMVKKLDMIKLLEPPTNDLPNMDLEKFSFFRVVVDNRKIQSFKCFQSFSHCFNVVVNSTLQHKECD